MSAVDAIIEALIAGGMTAGSAAAMVVRAAAEMSAAAPSRGRGAARMKEYRDRREALGLPRIFRAEQYQKPLEERDGRQCIYCRSADNLVIDHIDPLFLGGNDDPGNLGFACRPCNGRKAGKSLSDAGMKIVVASAHIAHTAYQSSKINDVNSVRTQAHTSEHVRGAPISSSLTSFNSQPLETTKKEKKKEATRRRVGCELPDDWSPGEKHYREAAERGRSPLDVQQLGEEMRLWSKANAHRAVARKSDWDSTFTGWIRREWGKLNGNENGQGTCGYRTSQASGSSQSGSDAILAGVARAADRRARERDADQPRDEPIQGGYGTAGSNDPQLL